MVISLINRIRATFGVELTICSLFETPTVSALIERMNRPYTTENALAVLLPLRRSGSRPPLFCFHPAGGFSWPYGSLLPYLPAEQPLNGLQARSLTCPELHASTMDTMAADCLREILTVQPHGPHYLLGWSLGGAIAPAVATQLQAQQENVELLAILDGYPVLREADCAQQTEQEILRALTRTLLDEPDETHHAFISTAHFKQQLAQVNHPVC